MTWVANELLLDKKYFYLECMRIPPDWHLWVYILGTEKEADEFQVKDFIKLLPLLITRIYYVIFMNVNAKCIASRSYSLTGDNNII